MGTKWTRGPWAVSQETIDPHWSIVQDRFGNIVANVNSRTGPDLPPAVQTLMPSAANARLIAAAPELAEALANLVALINAGCSADVIRDGETFKRARQALSAAGIEV